MPIKPAARLLCYSPPSLTPVGSLRALAEVAAGEGLPQAGEPRTSQPATAAEAPLLH